MKIALYVGIFYVLYYDVVFTESFQENAMKTAYPNGRTRWQTHALIVEFSPTFLVAISLAIEITY